MDVINCECSCGCSSILTLGEWLSGGICSNCKAGNHVEDEMDEIPPRGEVLELDE